MTYVDGCVIAVPTKNKDAYRAHAQEAAKIFKDHGALSISECWGDDVPKGTLTDFHRAVQAKEDETIVLSWILWPDKAARDAGMAKVMVDPRMDEGALPMPFDGKRMIFGGFDMMLQS